MKLYDALLRYTNENIDKIGQDFKVKLNLKDLPCEVQLNESDNLHKQNIDLRFALHDYLLENISNTDIKLAVIKWYIANWGGVKTNRESTLISYITSEPEELIRKGEAGIASWSKALSILNPAKYLIYDARVASALNSLQIINDVDNPTYYPNLMSRNKIISKSTIDRKILKKEWDSFKDDEFYNTYLELLHRVAENSDLKVSPHDIEMMLFAKAEDLVRQAGY